MQKESFGTTKQGQETFLYTIENQNGTTAKITDYGATLVSLLVKDKDGTKRDVVLGYDDVAEYEGHTSYFGATVGRNGNRIEGSKMTINGTVWKIEANEGENSLHSGSCGFNSRMWEVKEAGEDAICFSYLSTQEEQGFPGNLRVEVTYTITGEDALEISYMGAADADTVMNFTNHSYFNLGGHDSGSIMEHKLQIMADEYTPVKDSASIPTGEIAPVAGTPMDFRNMKAIGQEIDADFAQLNYTGGYDHNYVLSDAPGTMKVMANACCDKTGIAMEASTDCCGVQFYAGNAIGDQKGKGGADYMDRCGFCLESQFYPNAVNQENFPSPVVKAGEVYSSKTVYRFYRK